MSIQNVFILKCFDFVTNFLIDPLWDELIGHNQDIREEIRHRTSPRLVDTTYGSMGHQRHSLLERARDYVDAATASTSAEHLTSDEHAQLLQVMSIIVINIIFFFLIPCHEKYSQKQGC